jgi:hypothetical protein
MKDVDWRAPSSPHSAIRALLGLIACGLTDASAALSASARRAHLVGISSSSSSVCAVLPANKFVRLNLNRRTISI